jgi:hypothetical protein
LKLGTKFLKKCATPAATHDSATNDNTRTPDDDDVIATLPTPDSPMDQDATAEQSQQEIF